MHKTTIETNRGWSMMAKKIVIIGGVAGGATAAARIRRLDESAEILLLERGNYVAYANCGLPYYVGRVIDNRNNLFIMTPQEFKELHNIEVRVNNEVVKIDRISKEVEILDNTSGNKYCEKYDYVVLSPGAEQVSLNIPGVDNNSIFVLRSFQDADFINEYINNYSPKKAVIVGAGYVGLEMAENFKRRGMSITIVEGASQILSPLDKDMSVLIQQHLHNLGIKLFLNNTVKSFKDFGSQGIDIELSNASPILADIVLLCFGVKPNTKLALESGLEVSKGIVVNEYLQTKDASIYAIGDAIEVKNIVTGDQDLIPLAGPANKQGRIAANNICGLNERYNGSQGTSILKIYNLTAAATGANETVLNNAGISFKKVIIHATGNATYYPGAKSISLKLLFSPEGKVLGGQAVGYQGVDKRIDIIASVIRMGGNINDLKKLELSYAPPFSSAKDPVNTLGFIASNIMRGDLLTIEASDLIGRIHGDMQIVDVRELSDDEPNVIHGSLNIPLKDLRTRISELNPEKPVVTYCQVGIRSYFASRILVQKGFKQVFNLNGGYFTYNALKTCEQMNACYSAN